MTADHGSDRYDYIEVQAPTGVEPPPWLLAMCLEACQDCRANVFLRWDGKDWHRTVAHDDGCPTMARIEKDLP